MSKGIHVVDGDAVVGRTIGMVSEDEYLRQTLELVLGTFQGEWFSDPQEGIERDVILRKNYDEEDIRSTIEDAALRVNDKLTLTDFSLSVDAKRRASISVVFTKEDGNSLEVVYRYGD